MLNRAGDKRKIPLSDGETVVSRKKRRVRGKGRGQRKLQIKWATRTIPCAFSDLLTPATVITDVGTHMEVLDTVILKMTLSSNRLAMLQRDTPLSEQGIVAGDTLTLLVRHVTITDPDGIQHLVAYRADETIRDLLITLQGVSPISPLSDIIRFDRTDPGKDPTYFAETSKHLHDLIGYSSGHIHWAFGTASVDQYGMPSLYKRPSAPSGIGTEMLLVQKFWEPYLPP